KSACVALLLASTFNVHAQVDSTLYNKIALLVESTREQMAPDKRLTILEFTKSDIAANNFALQTSERAIRDTLTNRFASIDANIQITVFPTQEVADQPFGV